MKSHPHPFLVAGLAWLVVTPLPLLAQRADVHPAPRRQQTLDLGQRLLAPRPPTAYQGTRNPFTTPAGIVDQAAPDLSGQPGAPAPAARTDADLLAAISQELRPSGSVTIGGRPYLLFREKRLKVGDTLTVTFEAHDYTLTIAAIDGTQFTLRLHQQELTRPIRPASASAP